jgi:hypothetical protein
MIEVLPPLGKYKYDTWIIFPVKCYIDNSMRLWSCIRNVNSILGRVAMSDIDGTNSYTEYLLPGTCGAYGHVLSCQIINTATS